MRNSVRFSSTVKTLTILRRRTRTVFTMVLRFALDHPLGGAGAVVIIGIMTIAFFPQLISDRDPLLHDVPNRLRPPGREFWFGTDGFGRDVVSRIAHGAGVSLYVAGASISMGALAGTAIGTVSGYVGGLFDLVVQRFVDALLGIPFLILAIVIVVSIRPSTNAVLIAIAVGYAPQAVRLARATAASVKAESYVEAIQAIGAGPARIILRHILPNGVSPVVIHATGAFGTALVAEATLSFLGLGVPPPEPSWGRMLQEGARSYLAVAPWLTIVPGLALTTTVLSVSFVGDALRDLMDPRSTGAPRRHRRPASHE
ncbi:MAG: ABC transporter permease [Chloroflexi bacterium]|nr:ABC transporter permease [Chloroflexota bacterium]